MPTQPGRSSAGTNCCRFRVLGSARATACLMSGGSRGFRTPSLWIGHSIAISLNLSRRQVTWRSNSIALPPPFAIGRAKVSCQTSGSVVQCGFTHSLFWEFWVIVEASKTECRALDRTEKSEANAQRVLSQNFLRSFSSFRVSGAEIRKKDLKSYPSKTRRSAAFLKGHVDPFRKQKQQGANSCK